MGLVSLGVTYAGLIRPEFGLPVALIFIVLAGGQFQRGNARHFGKTFENEQVTAARKILEQQGYQCFAGKFISGVGDIDLVVSKGQSRATVEIKSFVHWRQLGPFMGDRERNALRQAARQAQSQRTNVAFIWLPQGRPTWLQILTQWIGNDEVKIIFGDARKLSLTLRNQF